MINKQQLTPEDINKVKFWYGQLDTWPIAAIERCAEDYYDNTQSGQITAGEKRFVDKCLDYFVNDEENGDNLSNKTIIKHSWDDDFSRFYASSNGNAAFFVLKTEMVIVSAQYVYDYNNTINKDNLAEYLVHPQDSIREFARLFYKDLCNDTKD